MINTIKENAISEIVIKKSKFIANIFYVDNEEMAKGIIKQINKEYNDARHNCYAYIIQEINGDDIIQIQKSSDNGEPSGTAGAPLLDLLKKQNLTNILIVVTRYFGGILLGTGGLVKAYTESATKALQNTTIINKQVGNVYEIQIDYGELKNIQHIADIMGYTIESVTYGENVKVTIQAIEIVFLELLKKCDIKKYKILKNNIWITS